MNEQGGFRTEVIERQLTHRDRNKVRRVLTTMLNTWQSAMI